MIPKLSPAAAAALLTGVLTYYAVRLLRRAHHHRGGKIGGKKAVFITGCDSGFGYSMAMFCRRRLGMAVIACCHMKHGRDGCDSLRENGCHVIEDFDVTDPVRVDRARDKVEEILNEQRAELWCVVNNAAVLVFGEAEWQTPAQISAQVQVNLVGPMLVTRALLPLLRRSRGRVINVTSACARGALSCFAVYAASKAGLECLSDGLRLELWKFGVDVVLLEMPIAPERTPLCSRQRQYHSEMAAAMSERDIEPAVGDHFRRSSELICSLFEVPPPLSMEEENDVRFHRVLTAALTDSQPKSLYRNVGAWDEFRAYLAKWLLPNWYQERVRRTIVPLPTFENK